MSADYPAAPGVLTRSGASPPVPADPSLPALASVLDGGEVAGWMAGCLGDRRVEARPLYLRYKPANKATVLYEVAVDGQWTAAVVSIKVGDLRRVLSRAEALRLVAATRSRCLSPEPLMYLDEPRALVEWYPARVAIPGLAFDAGRLGDELEAAGRARPDRDPVLVSYKPERRAVQRWGSFYVKAYIDHEQYQGALAGLERSVAVRGVGAPRTVASLPDERVTVQTALVSTGAAVSLPALGEVLSRLHATPRWVRLPRSTARDRLALARRTAAQLAWMLPDLAGPLASVLTGLEAGAPASNAGPVVSHGDLKLGNAMATTDGVALLDFDHMCLAEPACDAAMLAADVVAGGPGDLVEAHRMLEELLSGYGRRPADVLWHTAVSILCRAIYPFRLVQADWPARVRRMVEDATELSRAA